MAFKINHNLSIKLTHTPTKPLQSSQLCSEHKEALDTRKKKIGPYSFYQQDLIGSGSCGHVYKCIKQNKKDQIYAIKVVKVKKITKAAYNLLQNQINILQRLDHPNILKLYDVYYTENNCYLITDFCERGTLQNYIDSLAKNSTQTKCQWEEIIRQLIQGCKYLSSELIIHRDIKPANIFLKGNSWKIGDFGFARTIPSKQSQVYEKYTIGSPLYMPPQTLKRNIYSLKTDSFALGILIFYLINHEYPWGARSKKQLMDNYQTKKYPEHKLNFIPEEMKSFIIGLSQIDIDQRLYISEYEEIANLDLLKSEHTIASSEEDVLLGDFFVQNKLPISDQIKLCLFLNYIYENIQHFPEMSSVSRNIKRNLKFYTQIFHCFSNKNFQKYLLQFGCSEYKEFSSIQEIKEFYKSLENTIDDLDGTNIKSCKILQVKLIQYCKVLRCMIIRDGEELKKEINDLILNPDFNRVHLQEEEIQQIKNTIIKSHF